MELDNIKLDTTWNDAAGSVNKNFSKIKQAIAALVAEGGGLDEKKLLEYLVQNGYINEITEDMLSEVLGSEGNEGKCLVATDDGLGWADIEGKGIVVDSELSDSSENPVQNKVIKAYVDTKAKEAQAAAEQYIQNEVLTDYATTKYVGEREEYLVGYAEGLVNDLEKDIDGRGYLTSAAMNSYATKEDIKDFIAKGSTLDHYGITDAVKVGGRETTGSANDIETPSIVGYTNGMTDTPFTYGTLLTMASNPTYYVGQIAVRATGIMAFRGRNDSKAWTDWKTVVDSSNIGDYALPKAGGTITGNLILGASLHGAVPSGGTFYGYTITKSGDILYLISTKGNGTEKNGSIQLGGNGVPAEEIILYASTVKLTGGLKLSYGIEIGGLEKLTMGGGNIEGVGAIIHKNAGAYNIDANGNLYVDSAAETSYWQVKMTNGASALTVYAGTGKVETIKDTTIARYGGTVNIGYSTHPATTNIYGTLSLNGTAITSWDDIKASGGGDYLPLTGGTLTGALTINSTLSVSSSIFCYGNIKINAGGALQLGNEDAIKDWDSLRIKVVERTETSGVSIAPNVLNKWTTPLTSILTINFSAGRDGVANYYMMEFKTGATVPTITLPSGITWQGGDNILSRLEPNNTYQISVLNNLAVGGAF